MLLAVPDARATLSLAFDWGRRGLGHGRGAHHGNRQRGCPRCVSSPRSPAASMRATLSPPAPATRLKAALILRVASDPRLMELTRPEAGQQPEPLAGILRDVVAAANGSQR
jgi:hypothetical protein